MIKHSESGNFELETSAYRPVFQACVQEVGDDYIETMLAYAVSLRCKEVGKQMFDFISDVLIDKRDIIMTYGQQLRQEGRREGRQEGMQAKSLEIAKNMLSQLHWDLEVVKTVTGLSTTELEQLKNR